RDILRPSPQVAAGRVAHTKQNRIRSFEDRAPEHIQGTVALPQRLISSPESDRQYQPANGGPAAFESQFRRPCARGRGRRCGNDFRRGTSVIFGGFGGKSVSGQELRSIVSRGNHDAYAMGSTFLRVEFGQPLT